MTAEQFAAAVLSGVGARATSGAMRAMLGWMRAEGGHWNNSAKFNPLNTTQPEPGSATFRSVGQGAADIRIYKSWDQGVAATVKTLQNGRYGAIISALKVGDPGRVASAITSSPWGTKGSGVAAAINATPAPKRPHPAPAPHGVGAAPASQAPGGGVPTAPTTAEPVDAAGVRRAALRRYVLSQGTADQPNSLLALSSDLKATPPASATDSRTALTQRRQSPPAPTQSDGGFHGSRVLELIHNDGGKGYGIKDGKAVNGSQVFSGVWEGHKNHVHVAAGRKTVVALGKLAESMGLHVGENPHFGGVTPVHVQGSYHYKGEAIDVSGDAHKMDAYARRVEQYNRSGSL